MSASASVSAIPLLVAMESNASRDSNVNWTRELESLNKSVGGLQSNLFFFYMCTFTIITVALQIGYTFMDVGLVRTKSAGDMMLKTSIDFLIGGIAYWLVGFSWAFGDGNSFIGFSHFAFAYLPDEHLPTAFFHMVYANIASIIVSGAVAERLNLISYFIYSVTLTGFAYPLLSRWGWYHNGWLKALGYSDYSGSGLVFLFAGGCALVACKILGPRIGRFSKHGEKLPGGHSLTLYGLGFMILGLGFLGLNAGSLRSISRLGDGPMFSYASLNTLLACSSGAITSLFLQRFLPFWGHYWSYVTMCNGGVAAMVACCAGCNQLPTWAAYVTGACAGAAYLAVREILEKSKIDDPSYGIAMHISGGLVGLITGPLLTWDGLLIKQDEHSAVVLGVNVLGAVVIILWAFFWTTPLFSLLKYFGILRVSKEIEVAGIDLMQSDEQVYPPAAWKEANENIFSSCAVSPSPPITAPSSPPTTASNPSSQPPSISTSSEPAEEAAVFGRRRKPPPRLQTASLSSMNLISENTEIAMEQLGVRI